MPAPHDGRQRADTPRTVIHGDEKPTGRQIYRICRQFAQIADVQFPETRAAASALIGQLDEQLAALAPATDDSIPF